MKIRSRSGRSGCGGQWKPHHVTHSLQVVALLVLIEPAVTDAALNLWLDSQESALYPLRLRGGERQRTVSLEPQFCHEGEVASCHYCNLEKKSSSMSDLVFGDVIGFGSFSTVHAAETKSGGHVAVKKLRVPGKDLERDRVILKRMQREIHILAAIDHPNIVKLLDVFHDEEDIVSIVLERCMGGELFDFVNDFQTFHANGERSWQRKNSTERETVREEHIAKLVQQILLAVDHLHQRNIVHRDLKLENVMLEEPYTTKEEPRVKLIDFGFSCEHGGRRDMFTACGSTLYIAPEVLTAKDTSVGYGRECDLWAVGVMSFILLCCKPPFMGPTSYDIGCAIKAGKYEYPEYATVSDEAKDLIGRLLATDPLRRITATQALEHAWIRKHCDVPPPPTPALPKQSTGLRWGSRLGFQLEDFLQPARWLRTMVPTWHRTEPQATSEVSQSRVLVT